MDNENKNEVVFSIWWLKLCKVYRHVKLLCCDEGVNKYKDREHGIGDIRVVLYCTSLQEMYSVQ